MRKTEFELWLVKRRSELQLICYWCRHPEKQSAICTESCPVEKQINEITEILVSKQ